MTGSGSESFSAELIIEDLRPNVNWVCKSRRDFASQRVQKHYLRGRSKIIDQLKDFCRLFFMFQSVSTVVHVLIRLANVAIRNEKLVSASVVKAKIDFCVCNLPKRRASRLVWIRISSRSIICRGVISYPTENAN